MGKRSSFERRPGDFYATPLPAVLPLISHLRGIRTFAEPCAGAGDLVRHLDPSAWLAPMPATSASGQDALELDYYGAIDLDHYDPPETIRAVNPAFGKFLDEQDVLLEAERARRMPSFESAFRNLRLNQRIAPFGRDLLMKPEAWAVGDDPIDEAIFTDGRRCSRPRPSALSISRRWCWLPRMIAASFT